MSMLILVKNFIKRTIVVLAVVIVTLSRERQGEDPS